MSRIIIKNLPKHATDKRIREHFGAKGDVTDVRLVRTPDGVFRQFGFVGFKTEREAREAVKYFHGTYIDTSRIEVTLAKSFGDKDLPRAWSRYSEGSSAFDSRRARTATELAAERAATADKNARDARATEARAKAEVEATKTKRLLSVLYGDGEADPKLNEYLAVMQPRSVTKVWANDDAQVNAVANRARKQRKPKVVAKVESVGAKRPGGEGVLLTRTHVTFGDDADVDPENASEDDIVNGDGNAAVSADEDLDFVEEPDEPVARRPVSVKTAEIGTKGASHAQKKGDPVPTAGAKGTMASKVKGTAVGGTPARTARVYPALGDGDETIAESGRLFLRNIAFSCTEDDLGTLFKPFGPLSEVHVPIDKETKRPTGIAFVSFLMPEHAVRAYKELDAKIFQGRLLHILPAKALKADGRDASEDNAAGSSFKKGKDKKKKEESGSDHNWNTLFIRQDTVVSAMADKYGVSKGDILDAESGGAAVRVALGETHVIAETRRFLEDHGVSLNAFGGRPKARSTTVIVVKNIPHDTSSEELRAMFAKHGTLGRVVVPPTRACALVEYLEPSEARAGLRHLAYTKFKSVPLYLEWAPEGAFSSPPPALGSAANDGAPDVAAVANAVEDDADDNMTSATVFVKNLSFATTDESLRAAFEQKIGNLRSAIVAKKKDPKQPGVSLSMGFGFVEFATKEDALKAVRTMQNSSLDGHALQLKMSTRKGPQSANSAQRGVPATETKAKSTKLLVRNVPFEASKKELKELFGTFGQLKSLRMPKKFDGTHRGFAFIEYMTKQESLHGFQSLSATHLYGRHLVIEWAKEEASVEALREKTQKRFREDSDPRRSNKKIILEDGAKDKGDESDNSDDMEVDAEM